MEHFASVRARLVDLGWSVVEVEAMPDFEEIDARHRRLVAAEAAEVHRDWFARHGQLYAPKTAELIRRGQAVTSAELDAALAGRYRLREELGAAMESRGIDFWISPPARGPAPLGLESTGDPVMNLPWTHAGVPTLVVPAGATADGLPMGLQIAGAFGGDEGVLAVGALLEHDLAAVAG
jgi:Asp-tRNA(Asn)/Glu-tRNA(Gln) amidotransferase A subunit family amidase